MIRVGIIGVGTVGSHVVKILQENEDIITARSGKKIVPILGIVRDLTKKRDVGIPLSAHIDDVLENPEIDVVIEHAAKMVAYAINRALQPTLSLEDLVSLVG